jgi:hypothetical protein
MYPQGTPPLLGTPWIRYGYWLAIYPGVIKKCESTVRRLQRLSSIVLVIRQTVTTGMAWAKIVRLGLVG